MAFDVEITSVPPRLEEGGTIDVGTRVTNTQQGEFVEEVTLDIDGTQEDSERVTLNTGGELRFTLEWETGSGDDGEHTATVSSDTDSDSKDFIVVNPVMRVRQGRIGPSSSPPWVEDRVDNASDVGPDT